MRFAIRRLLLAFAGVAVVGATFVAARNIYYSERRQTESALAHVKGISNVQLHPHFDLVEAVNSSRFSVDSHPGSIVTLGGLTRYADEGRFSVSRIGQWTFRVTGRGYVGAYRMDTSEPVESEYFGSNIILGANSPYNHMLPFEINTLQDLVDHYGDLVDLFETWPREDKPGTVTLEDGTTEFFYVVNE